MSPANAIQAVGYYCGRLGPGFFGEPLNSFSNLAFVLGAAGAWSIWRSSQERDSWQLLLFVLAALIGVGSFVFHSHPTPETLLVDLVPIQVFGLAALAYVCLRYIGLRTALTVAIALGFLVLRQAWLVVMPRGALGGGVTHIPSLVALLVIAVALMRKGSPLSRYLFAACGAYLAAIFVRSWDLYLCPAFPFGVHWVWHVLTAVATSLIVVGMARVPPARRTGGGGGVSRRDTPEPPPVRAPGQARPSDRRKQG